jgi:hypothetical protein
LGADWATDVTVKMTAIIQLTTLNRACVRFILYVTTPKVFLPLKGRVIAFTRLSNGRNMFEVLSREYRVEKNIKNLSTFYSLLFTPLGEKTLNLLYNIKLNSY